MSLEDLTCDICGMRYADTRLYKEHLVEAHDGLPDGDPDTQEQTTGMPTGSMVREDI